MKWFSATTGVAQNKETRRSWNNTHNWTVSFISSKTGNQHSSLAMCQRAWIGPEQQYYFGEGCYVVAHDAAALRAFALKRTRDAVFCDPTTGPSVVASAMLSAPRSLVALAASPSACSAIGPVLSPELSSGPLVAGSAIDLGAAAAFCASSVRCPASRSSFHRRLLLSHWPRCPVYRCWAADSSPFQRPATVSTQAFKPNAAQARSTVGLSVGCFSSLFSYYYVFSGLLRRSLWRKPSLTAIAFEGVLSPHPNPKNVHMGGSRP